MKKILKAFICTLTLIPMMGFGQIVKTVEASGMGSSEKSALMDAKRNAVSQVVSTLVESQTTTLDEDIVEDKIISVSGGFIDNMKVIEPAVKNASGGYTIKIKADVKYDQLSTEIAKYSSSSKKIDMTSIISKQAAKEKEEEQARRATEDDQEDMGTFIIKLVDDYMKTWKFETTECLPGKAANEVSLVIKGYLTNDNYVSKFVLPTQQKLKKLGIFPGKAARIRMGSGYSRGHYFQMNATIGGKRVTYPLAVFDDDVFLKTQGSKSNFGKFVYDKMKKQKYIVRIELKDDKGESLSCVDYDFLNHYDTYRMPEFDISMKPSYCIIFPSLRRSSKDETITWEKSMTMKVYEPHQITDITQIDVKVLLVDKDSPCDGRW